MISLFDTRRYLTNFDSVRIGHMLTDVLVIGSGVAGARAAIEAAKFGSVTLVTKSSFEDSSTHYAQGGIAAAIGKDDSHARHVEDTMRVGCGLCDAQAVEYLVEDGARRIEELSAWGMQFDRGGGDLNLGREGGHSVNRIIHAHGDQTGRELAATLMRRVCDTKNLRLLQNCFVIDLLDSDGSCAGAVTYHRRHGHQLIWAKQTVLASGGCGRIWRETTNPQVATGDGLAAAFRLGVPLRDMEMMQFHPTTLYVAGAGRALISEAVRGEGGYLVDRAGDRFMHDYHADAELAPRDVVSRAIHTHLLETRSNCVFLDVRHIRGFAERFPKIAGLCSDFEIDVSRDLIPVRPSAHYMIGGVVVEHDGASSVDGLLCCGEAASTGVHGANRLASNSLLEGLVYGKLAGETAGQRAVNGGANRGPVTRLVSENPHSPRTSLDLPDIRQSLRSVMWRNAGIVREADRLGETCEILRFWAHFTLDKTLDSVSGWELQNQLTVAHAIASSALERGESIGVHWRADAEEREVDSPYHVVIIRDNEGSLPKRVAH